MWQLIAIILCFTCVQSYYQRPTTNSYAPYKERLLATGSNPQANQRVPSSEYNHRPSFGSVGGNLKTVHLIMPISSQYLSSQATPQLSDPRAPIYNYPYNGAATSGSNLRETQPSQKSDLYSTPTADLFDLDYGSLNDGADNSFTDPATLIEPRNTLDTPSYYEELELTEKFASYLKRRTRIDTSSTAINDAAHQYNALLAVIITLAKSIRNSCTQFDQVYDQIYLPTVETYYKYGVANAEKVTVMIEDYIRRGNSHMPKIRKLKEEICDNELFCAASFDSHINNSPLVYVKELETLEALAHLARGFYPYIDEFNQAAKKGTVLQYLQKSKDKLKGYVMNVVNSVEHLSDKSVRCV